MLALVHYCSSCTVLTQPQFLQGMLAPRICWAAKRVLRLAWVAPRSDDTLATVSGVLLGHAVPFWTVTGIGEDAHDVSLDTVSMTAKQTNAIMLGMTTSDYVLHGAIKKLSKRGDTVTHRSGPLHSRQQGRLRPGTPASFGHLSCSFTAACNGLQQFQVLCGHHRRSRQVTGSSGAKTIDHWRHQRKIVSLIVLLYWRFS